MAEGRLYYEAHGEGPPVIFAHGAGGNLLSWFQQLSYFRATNKSILFDHRGFGRSAFDPDAVDVRDFAGDVIRVADAAGADRCAIVCQSMGGWSGLGAALRHPDRVTCLVLSATPGGITTPEVTASFGAAQSRAAGGEPPSHLVLSEAFRQRAPALAVLYDLVSGLNAPLGAILRQLGDPERGVSDDALSAFQIPTLVLAGEEDPIFPPATLESVARLIPGSEFAVVKGSGHSPYYECPERFNAIVAEFISRNP
jgi:pimeloyl-ACP methyl ester carboxylesterase